MILFVTNITKNDKDPRVRLMRKSINKTSRGKKKVQRADKCSRKFRVASFCCQLNEWTCDETMWRSNGPPCSFRALVVSCERVTRHNDQSVHLAPFMHSLYSWSMWRDRPNDQSAHLAAVTHLLWPLSMWVNTFPCRRYPFGFFIFCCVLVVVVFSLCVDTLSSLCSRFSSQINATCT